MKKQLIPTVIFIAIILFFSISCRHNNNEEPEDTTPVVPPINSTTPVLGYGILNHLPGIWNGPVTSSTPLGGYPEWIVDLRPVSPSQVSSKSELDSVNNILMGFFIVKHANAYKIAFRNGGGFAGQQRIAYAVIDSASEQPNNYFYRFSDFRAGANRVYTNVLFRNDSLMMTVYTNQYNSLATPVIHMQWKAKLQDSISAQAAIANFSFPQKTMVRGFSTTFDSQPEAIYYDLMTDPYNESMQPYLGQTTVNINFGATYTPDPNKKVFLMITTQPLFSGFTYLPANLIYRSRYVFLASTDHSFTFNYMHPGSYYLYTLYDANGDGTFSSGDWMSSNLSNTFSLPAVGTATVNTTIDFTIP
ncbi:MAG: hypothetical protein ABIQ40_11955 [Bacteroidia bacterium]